MASAHIVNDSLAEDPGAPGHRAHGVGRDEVSPGGRLSEWSALAHGEGKGKNQRTARARAARCVPITRLRPVAAPA